MRIAWIVAAAGPLALGGCSGPASLKDAGEKIETFHHQIDAGDYQAILQASGPELQADRQKLTALLGAVHAKLGRVRESKQVGWRSDVNTAGSFATVNMATTFEHGTAQETFVYKTYDKDEKLAGYHIESADMMVR